MQKTLQCDIRKWILLQVYWWLWTALPQHTLYPHGDIDTNKYSVFYNCRNFFRKTATIVKFMYHGNHILTMSNTKGVIQTMGIGYWMRHWLVLLISAVACETLSNIKAYGEYRNRSKHSQIESQILYRRKYCKCFTIVTILKIKFMTLVSYPYGVPQYYTNALD